MSIPRLAPPPPERLTCAAKKTHVPRPMSSFLIRPRFNQVVEFDAGTVRRKIADQVEQDGGRVELKSFPDYLCLRIPEKDRHFWSPRLNLSLETTEDGKTRIKGTYGPNGNVWALYLYGYLIVGSLGSFAGILGFCQWMLGNHPWGMWIFAVMLAAAAAMYVMAQFGQKLGARQTFLLHQTYESAVGQPVEIH